jgi:single-strand DNA-binding protein
MYLNTVTLTGFIGADSETRTTKSNASFTTFSLATKTSWKDRESGEWQSHTEWHSAVVFGRLHQYAAALKKGDHVEIRGQLRTREYQGKDAAKRRVTQIRVFSILKLERSRKSDAAESELQEVAA